MNAVKAPVLAAFGIMVLTGCTTTRTLSVSVENRTAPGYVQGKPLLQSVKRNTVAVWLLTPTYKTDLGDLLPPAFIVAVRNGGDQTISFSRDDVTATVEGRPIHILTYEEYRGEIYRQQVWEWARAHWAAEGPIFQEANRFPQERRIHDGGRTKDLTDPMYAGYYGPPMYTDYYGPVSTDDMTLDELLADARLMLVLDHYPIAPGQAVKGVVRLKPSDLSSGQQVRILVKAGDETHEFLYDVRS